MEPWRTAIATSDETHIWIRGYEVTALMTRAGFTDTIFLLHQGRLPTAGERRLLDAILVAPGRLPRHLPNVLDQA